MKSFQIQMIICLVLLLLLILKFHLNIKDLVRCWLFHCLEIKVEGYGREWRSLVFEDPTFRDKRKFEGRTNLDLLDS